VFRDTLIDRPDTNHYTSAIHAFVADPFHAEPGNRYNLLVTTEQFGSATASVTLPDKPIITVYPSTFALDHPEDFQATSFFYVRTTLSPVAKGSWCQFFIDYQVFRDTAWVDARMEVPYVINVDTLGVWVATYPKLTRVTGSSRGVAFKFSTYRRMLARVFEQFPNLHVAIKRVVLRVFQCEQGYYDYYNTVNGFRDPLSIRVDRPDYTNIRGGLGLFGAYTLDSLVHEMPASLQSKLR